MTGMVVFMSNAQMDEVDRRKVVSDTQSTPVIVGLAGYIRDCYDAARDGRRDLDTRMLKCLRQRLGEYEPDFLADLAAQGGGSIIYMLLTQTKCRGAEAWLRDIMLSQGEVPWDATPTPVPDVASDEMAGIMQYIGEQVSKFVQMTGQVPEQYQLGELREMLVRKVKMTRMDEATQAVNGMKELMRDQLAEGGFTEAMDDFLSDLCTYPYAIMKGPVVTIKPKLSWATDMLTGKAIPSTEMRPVPIFQRISPFDIYIEPGVKSIQDGYVIERHEMSRKDLAAMVGHPGYDEYSVRQALQDYEHGMLNEWLTDDRSATERRRLENKSGLMLIESPAPTFNVLEFSGSVSGRMLIDWGMEDIEDADTEYEVNAWMVGKYVIRAVMNTDPLHEKPYRVATFNKVPGAIAGMALPELIADSQAMANAAARAVANNMAIASGPQVEVNIDRMPTNETITEVSPWRIWQVLNDPLGASAPAVRFNQPNDNSGALMMVFERFSRQADEHSGIPAYSYGDTDIQGAGRTSSGLAMLMGSAGKGIRQIITNVDIHVIQPLLRQLYRYNMKHSDDDTIKMDADIVPKGMAALVKEQVNMRRIEFLQATANPIDSAIVGPKGRAAILREVARGLEMDVEKIIPSEEELELMDKAKAAMEAAQPQQPAIAAPNGRPEAATMDQGAAARNMGT